TSFSRDWSSDVCSSDLSYSRNSSGLDNRKKAPTIQKGDEFVIGFFEIDVLPSCFGEHSAELSVAHSSNNCNYSREYPSQNKPARTTNLQGHCSTYDKNS